MSSGNAEVVDAIDVPSRAVALRDPVSVGRWTPTMVQTIEEGVAQVHMRDEFMKLVMRKDLDYGVIPGTGTKPTLLKPGAERLLSAYGLRSELVDEVIPVQDWTGIDHGGEPFFQYRRACYVWHQTGPGEHDRELVAKASGECNSFESKYRYRTADRVCPNCGEAAIKKSRGTDRETGKPRTGWYCWNRPEKGFNGCGQNWDRDDEPSIVGQETGRKINPDVADVVNTILKMADKRALVAATILATGWSDLVTQDIDNKL